MTQSLWLDDNHVLRGVGPFTPKDRIVEVEITPAMTPVEITRLVLEAYEKAGIKLPPAPSGQILDEKQFG